MTAIISEPAHIISTEMIIAVRRPGIGDPAEQPAAERPHEEPGREHARGVEQLGRAVAGREERAGEIQRGEGIDVEVVPFDQIARGGADDGEDAAPAIGTRSRRHRQGSGGDAHALLPHLTK